MSYETMSTSKSLPSPDSSVTSNSSSAHYSNTSSINECNIALGSGSEGGLLHLPQHKQPGPHEF